MHLSRSSRWSYRDATGDGVKTLSAAIVFACLIYSGAAIYLVDRTKNILEHELASILLIEENDLSVYLINRDATRKRKEISAMEIGTGRNSSKPIEWLTQTDLRGNGDV